MNTNIHNFLIFIFFLIFQSFCIAQNLNSFSVEDLKNNLSNSELDKLKKELLSESVYEKTPSNLNSNFSNETTEEISSIIINDSLYDENDDEPNPYDGLFGYNYFMNEIEYFDNLPVPASYKLGPGDEIIISLWGETNLQIQSIIDKDGLLFIENIGFVNLSNMTLSEAKKFLIEKMSKSYSTLNEESKTDLMISLGQLKSINVYFSGQVNNPGISLVHPFSDIFTSLAQAGGINPNGSLRNVQLIRNNKIINTIDFYSFFLDGKNNFSNLKIIDGDVIHVPRYHRRIEVAGEVINGGFYEFLENETIVDAISFAGGLTEKASSKAILDTITPIEFRVSDDNAFSNTLVSYEEFSSFNFNDGYKITFLKIPEVKTNAQVFGRVKSPGLYPSNNNSLKDVLEVAGGFNDPTFLKTINLDEIIILRKDENNFYAKEIVTTYENSENVMLMPEDKIFVYEQTNYRNIFSYRVEGEVSKPGTFPLKKGITVSDAIKLAGGITELSDNLNIVLYQEFTEIDDTGKEVLSLKPVNDTQLDFELGINSVIKVIPKENVVNVAGNVYSPGLVAYSKKLTASKAIELAGGYKPYSLKNRVYIKRANGNIEQVGFLGGRSFRLYPGDSIYVPENPSPSDFKVDEFIANLSVTLANLAAIFVVIDKN